MCPRRTLRSIHALWAAVIYGTVPASLRQSRLFYGAVAFGFAADQIGAHILYWRVLGTSAEADFTLQISVDHATSHLLDAFVGAVIGVAIKAATKRLTRRLLPLRT